MQNFIIYRILNLKTRKFYIGRTESTLKKRWSVHLAHAKYGDRYVKNGKKVGQSYLYKSMRKYGIENFEIKQIDEGQSFDHMVFLENFYILYYNSLNPKYGYNLVTNKYDIGEQRITSKELKKELSFKAHIRYNKPSGVTFDKKRGKFYLAMKRNGIKLISKRFTLEKDAMETHDKIELLFYKEHPLLYFPDKIEEYQKEDLELFYIQLKEKKKTFSSYTGLSKSRDGFNVSISTEVTSGLFIGFEKEEESAAVRWDKAAYFLGYNKEELNLPNLWNEGYYDAGKKIIETYSNPKKQVQRKNGKTSIYNGVNKRSIYTWEMTISINGKKIRETYREERDAAIAYDYYIQSLGGSKNKLNFPSLISESKPKKLEPYSCDSFEKLERQHHSLNTEFPSVKIKCLDTGVVYASLSEAAKKNNIPMWKFQELKKDPYYKINNMNWERI